MIKDLVTERLKLKDLYPERAEVLAKEHDIDIEDLELVRKGIVAEKAEVDKDERAVTSYINTATKDRDNEIMEPEGVILTHYRKNPVVPYGHDYRGLPVGKNIWIKKDKKGLMAKTVFLKHQLADDVYRLYSEDVAGTGPAMKGWSVGFIPLKWERPNGKERESKEGEADTGTRRIYKKWELVEYSAVMIPSNREALTEMVEKGLITSEKLRKDIGEFIEIEEDGTPDLYTNKEGTLVTQEEILEEWIKKEVVTKPEETEEYIRLPAKGEEGKHKGHKIRWITVSKKEGIKGIYCIDCKKIITFVFDKNPPYNWTMKRALKWMKEHGKDIKVEAIKAYGKELVFITEGNRTLDFIPPEEVELSEEQIEEMGFTVTKAEDKKEEDKLNKERTIWLFGSISAGTAQSICNQLFRYDKLDSEKPIKLIIGSYGGEVYSSFAIIDAMEYIKAPVETIGLGMVMSGGLLIFMAGDNRKISQNASVLSHRFFSINWGSQAELEADRVEDDAIHNRMIEHYIKFTKLKTKEEVLEKLLQPTNVWLTAAQAIEYEIADEFVDNDWLSELEGKAKYDCECIECGHKLTSDKHCKDIKCPKCGGQMRRVERPGPGQESLDGEVIELEENEIKRATPHVALPLMPEKERWNPGDVPDSKIIEAILGRDPADGEWTDQMNANAKKVNVWWDGKGGKIDAFKLKIGRRVPITDKSGPLKYNWRQTASRMAILMGARGGVDIPEGQRKGCYDRLVKVYKMFDKEPPEFREYTEEELKYIKAGIDGTAMEYLEATSRNEDPGLWNLEREWADTVFALWEKKELLKEPKTEKLIQRIEILADEIKSLKEGRVLSEKNRKLVKQCADMLLELYNATEPPQREEFELEIEEGKKDMGKDDKKLEIDKETLTLNIASIIKNKIEEMVQSAIKKARGKVE